MKVFITGGTTGIGMSLAKKYLDQGDVVGICGRNKEHYEQSFSSVDENYLKRISFYQADVTHQDQLKQAIEKFSGTDGIDLVIANAGISVGSKTKLPDFDKARKVMNVNIIGVLNTFEVALNIMLNQERKTKKKGHLVALASVAGLVGLPKTAAYSASKAAILKLCESYSMDLEPYGIAVTTIAPGFIDTPLTRKNKHKMPFLMPVDIAATKIYNAIKKNKKLYILPWQMKVVMLILYYLPRGFYRFLMKVPFKSYIK